MSQPQRGKSPLDVLQSMINAILIETGKALRVSNKESGKSLAAVNNRIRSTIPGMIENFHQALDELECDIIRAKSVLLRDLEDLRAKRIALENPAPIVEEVETKVEDADMPQWLAEDTPEVDVVQPALGPAIKEQDEQAQSPEKPDPSAPAQSQQIDDIPKDVAAAVSEVANGNDPDPTPPTSITNGSKPVTLGIDTEATTDVVALATAEQLNSSVDSLFDDDNNGDSDLLNFDGMDFLQDSNTVTQGNDHSQTQHDDFDLSNFGSTAQEFSMTDLQTSTQDSTVKDSSANKQDDDLFAMANDQNDDNMDLEFDLAGEEGSFNDMFLDTGNDLDHDLDATFFES